MATPETLIKQEIKDWLDIQGWFHFHILQGLGSFRGSPDMVAIKNGIVLFIEIKRLKGTLSENQEIFRDKIQEHGGHYVVARGYEDIEKYISKIKEV